MSSDRLYLASEVTRRLNYIQRDAIELERLLQGEALSDGYRDSLALIIEGLQRVAAARPAVREAAE